MHLPCRSCCTWRFWGHCPQLPRRIASAGPVLRCVLCGQRPGLRGPPGCSGLYFWDLFCDNNKSAFKLSGTLLPAGFQQILSFYYSGRLTAREQPVAMFAAGLQHIVALTNPMLNQLTPLRLTGCLMEHAPSPTPCPRSPAPSCGCCPTCQCPPPCQSHC